MKLRFSSRPLLAILCLASLLARPAVPASPRSVVVIKSRNLAPYNQAVKGLRASLGRRDPAVRVEELELPLREAEEKPFLDRVQKSLPDLIVTVGTQATRAVRRRVEGIPVVFSLVLMAGEAEQFTPGRSGRITGAAMDIPIAVQFERMKEVIRGLKRVGVIFNPRETGKVVRAARAAAAAAGLELIEIPVSTEAEVMKEVDDLKGRVDVLWSVADRTVFTPRSVDYILLLTIRQGIPFVGLSPSFVKAGALLSFSCDYEDVGVQAGELAIEVLRGQAPESLPIVYPRHVSLYLNLNTARAINLDISEKVRSESQVHFQP